MKIKKPTPPIKNFFPPEMPIKDSVENKILVFDDYCGSSANISINSIIETLNKVPDKYRNSAFLKINSYSSYEESEIDTVYLVYLTEDPFYDKKMQSYEKELCVFNKKQEKYNEEYKKYLEDLKEFNKKDKINNLKFLKNQKRILEKKISKLEK